MKRLSPSLCQASWTRLGACRSYASKNPNKPDRSTVHPYRVFCESPAWETHAARIRAKEAKHAVQILEERGLIKQIAGDREKLIERLTSQRVSAYSGIDPTAASLHLGHLIPLNALFWLFECGHTAISLIGTATARIGDPTDRLHMRTPLEKKEHNAHGKSMRLQLKSIWRRVDEMLEQQGRKMSKADYGFREDMGPTRQIESNDRWLNKITLPQYLRTVGRCAKVGAMLSRDTVKNRLEKGESMTLAEFNYPLVQALDWFHMFAEKGTEIQIGGSDQYGNIVAGMEYISYMQRNHPVECQIGRPTLNADGKSAFGITTPLLETSAGEKFGKSAGNAVWLDPQLTTPFQLYGHLLRTSDDDVERFLKLLTLVPLEEIERTMGLHREDPSKRVAQHLLAREICQLAHGRMVMEATVEQHAASRAPKLENLAQENGEKAQLLPRSLVEQTPLVSLAALVGVTTSVKEAKKLRDQGGLYVSVAAGDDALTVEFKRADSALKAHEALIGGRFLVLRSGKWKTVKVEVLDDAEFDRRGLRVGEEDWRERIKAKEERQERQTETGLVG